ncbi:acylphosphatase [Verrucomicrobia bacterium]|nr:acylphosphatase [Verrucomicrobiota bacterium]
MAIKRLTVFYTGRVQGVGFRFMCKQVAMGFDLAGTIRNLPDGRVELVIEGDADELDEYRQAARDAGLDGFIRQEMVKWSAAEGTFKGFQIVT